MIKDRNHLPLKWLYIIFAAVLIGLLVWNSMQTLRETPTREVSLELSGQGWITLSLSTDPFPPLPTGIVTISLRASNSRGVVVDLGNSLLYSFGSKGSAEAFKVGEAIRNGSTYQAGITFPTPGDYWLRFDLGNGQQAEFQLYVEPAQ